MSDSSIKKTLSKKKVETKHLMKSPKNDINDIFQLRMLSDLLRKPKINSSKPQKKYKSFHRQLLEKYIEKGRSRGKMINYVEYSCSNSDDDSSDASDSYESSLFYRYGMTSRIAETSSKTLPIWNSKKSKVIKSQASKHQQKDPRLHIYNI
jgi:hypothetical protein